MLDNIDSKTVHRNEEGDRWRKKKKTLSEVKYQKHKEESAEFSRDKSRAKRSPSFT